MCCAGRDSSPPASAPPLLVVGLGNPFLRDDAAGILLAREVRRLLGGVGVEFREAATGGLELLELLEGRAGAVVIDAVLLEGEEPGRLFLLDLEGPLADHFDGGTHHLGLLEGLELARRLGIPMPSFLRVYALQVEDPFTFGEDLTPRVREALPRAARRIAREIRASCPFRISGPSPSGPLPPGSRRSSSSP